MMLMMMLMVMLMVMLTDDADAGVCVMQGGMLVCELCDSVYHPECCSQPAPRGEQCQPSLTHLSVMIYSLSLYTPLCLSGLCF